MNCQTIYYRARVEASRENKLLSNRQRAGELLYVSQEALSDYELGRTIPPCDVVAQMVEVYGAPWLQGAHVRGCCPLMHEVGCEHGELQRAALSWVSQLQQAEQLYQRFVEVAMDGRICEHELETAQHIRSQAVALSKAMQEGIVAIDAAVGGRK